MEKILDFLETEAYDLEEAIDFLKDGDGMKKAGFSSQNEVEDAYNFLSELQKSLQIVYAGGEIGVKDKEDGISVWWPAKRIGSPLSTVLACKRKNHLGHWHN
jgi:exonuclease VII small subunit